MILSTDCDMASLHTIITKFPSNVTDIEQMEVYIEQALELFQKYPPESLADLNEKWLDKWYISIQHLIDFYKDISYKIQIEVYLILT